MEHTHHWIIAPYRKLREQSYPEKQDRTIYVTEAHCNRRGPYTGTGNLLRQIIPYAYKKWPALVDRHALEILSVAPELKSVISASVETLTSLAIPEERTRFYSALRTLRIANGLVDFLLALANPEKMGKLTLIYEEMHACDGLDAEFISTLLRRAKPALIQVMISSNEEIERENLREALEKYATSTILEAEKENAESIPSTDSSLRLQWAKNYVESDGTSDQPHELAAYESTPLETRQKWHDERAEYLSKRDEWTLHLGAIPYHRERGSSSEKAIDALREAVDYCTNMGFYEINIDIGHRGRKWVTWETDLEHMWIFTTKITTALAALNQPDQALPLFDEALENMDNQFYHMKAAYSLSMLYTRYKEQRDHDKAKEWILKAIELSNDIEDEKNRTFYTVFNQNGLALVELHLNNPDEALRLVTEGWEKLNQVLEPEEHLLHRSVLLFNKGKILNFTNHWDEAIEAYNRVIEIDPNYAEYHFERGNLYSNMGDLQKAIEDYNQAIKLSPPFPEVYYNRAAAYNRLGNVKQAMADYNYLLEIEPDHLDGLLNRATLLYEMGQIDAARQDVMRGLQIESDHAQLLCTLGLIEMAEENNHAALEALDAALTHDEQLLEALTNRAVLHFELENHEDAIRDLTEAMQIEKNATVLFNRAWVYQAQEQWSLAIADYSEALSLPDTDEQEIYYQRGLCFIKQKDFTSGYDDWRKHLTFGASPYEQEIYQQLPSQAQ